MTQKVQQLIEAFDKLSPIERIEFAQSLPLRPEQLGDFWKSPSLEDLARQQNIHAVCDLDELAGDFWPEDETTEQFLTFLYQQRQEDIQSQ